MENMNDATSKALRANYIRFINGAMNALASDIREHPADWTAPGSADALTTADHRVFWTVHTMPDSDTNRFYYEARIGSHDPELAGASNRSVILGFSGEQKTRELALCEAWIDWKANNSKRANEMVSGITDDEIRNAVSDLIGRLDVKVHNGDGEGDGGAHTDDEAIVLVEGLQ